MACDITAGRREECKDNVGGIKAVYFGNFDGTLFSGATIGVDEEITALASPFTVYKYELKGTNSYEEENVKGNSTSSYNQTGTIYLKKQNATTLKEMKLLSYSRPQVLIEDHNGLFRLAGAENGIDVQVNNSTGASLEEDNGYSLTLTGQERFPAPFVDSAIVDIAGGFVIVEGTN